MKFFLRMIDFGNLKIEIIGYNEKCYIVWIIKLNFVGILYFSVYVFL